MTRDVAEFTWDVLTAADEVVMTVICISEKAERPEWVYETASGHCRGFVNEASLERLYKDLKLPRHELRSVRRYGRRR